MDSLKNFSITFVIALLIFGLLALFLTPFAVQSFQGGLLTDKQTEQPTPDADEQVNNQAQTDTDLSNINGSSFTVLIAGVDYLPLAHHAGCRARHYTTVNGRRTAHIQR